MNIINDPTLNKGTAFTQVERDRLGIRGLLPPRVNRMEDQAARFMQSLEDAKGDDDAATRLRQFNLAQALLSRNETLFYYVVSNNIERMAPIIYTPTVGLACQKFGNIYNRPKGMYFSADDRGDMTTMIYNYPHSAVDVVVMTDGGRVLGLGDLGAHGMGIPIGKLSLYVAVGGINPRHTLPIMLDVGTNNTELLSSPFYIGIARRRLTGDEYFEVLDEVMAAINIRYPRAMIQFEDFSSSVAHTVLARYRDKYCCFNDDIQGTGSVVVAGLMSALRLQGKPVETLKDQRIVIMGCGSAGLGVASGIRQAMIYQGATEEEANRAFYMMDEFGLVTKNRPNLPPALARLARDDLEEGLGLYQLVKRANPTMLLGLTGRAGLFTEQAVRQMAAQQTRPVVFPLSNPTHLAECTAEQAYNWTDGRAIFASGSPFHRVHLPDGRVCYPSQSNNMYIYPAIGLAVSLCRARTIPDEMFYLAAKALVEQVPEEQLRTTGHLFPSLSSMRKVSEQMAVRLIEYAIDKKLARLKGLDIENFASIEKYVQANTYTARYSRVGWDEDE